MDCPIIQKMERKQTPPAAKEELHEDSKLLFKVRCLSCMRAPKLSCTLHLIAIANEVLMATTHHFLCIILALLLALLLAVVVHFSRDDKPYRRLFEFFLAYYCLAFCLFASYCGVSGLVVPYFLEMGSQAMLVLGFGISYWLHCGADSTEEEVLPRWKDSRAGTNGHRHPD